jgi:hypothetical protein
VELGILGAIEKLLQFSALAFQRNHFQADFVDLFAQRRVRPSNGIDMPTQDQEKQAGDQGNTARRSQKAAVCLNRFR